MISQIYNFFYPILDKLFSTDSFLSRITVEDLTNIFTYFTLSFFILIPVFIIMLFIRFLFRS